MRCRCKNNELFPTQFYVGERREWSWYDAGHTQVSINKTWPDSDVVMSFESFKRTFDYEIPRMPWHNCLCIDDSLFPGMFKVGRTYTFNWKNEARTKALVNRSFPHGKKEIDFLDFMHTFRIMPDDA